MLLILVGAVMSILNVWPGGISAMVAATDKESFVYGDFHDYYYPAGRMILKVAKPLGGYFYTPSFALLLHFFTPESYGDAIILWGVFQHLWIILLFIIPGIYLAARSGKKLYFYLYILLTLLCFPLYHNLKWGQLSVMIVFCTIFALILHERRQYWLAAISLATATLAKYYPATFIIYFIIRRDTSFIGKFTVVMLIMGLLLPATVFGFATTGEFYRLLHAELDYARDWVIYDMNSQFFPHVVLRMAGMEAEATARGILAIAGMLICLMVFYKIHKATMTGKNDSMFSASAVFLLFPLMINTSWPHYFVYMPFCITLLLQECRNRRQKWILMIITAMQSLLIFSLTDYQTFSGSGTLLAANMLLLYLWFDAQKTSPGSGCYNQNPEVSCK